MKRLLTYALLALVAALYSTVGATTTAFDFSNKWTATQSNETTVSTQTDTLSGITCTFEGANGMVSPQTGSMRMKKGSTLTLSISSGTITSITIVYQNEKQVPQSSSDVTVNTGTFTYNTSSTTSMWSGNTSSVTFTFNASDADRLDISYISIEYTTTSLSELTRFSADGMNKNISDYTYVGSTNGNAFTFYVRVGPQEAYHMATEAGGYDGGFYVTSSDESVISTDNVSISDVTAPDDTTYRMNFVLYAKNPGTATLTFYYTGSSKYAAKSFTTAELTVTSVEAPTLSPEGGEYTEAQTVTMTTATDGATIYYTTDGSTPTSSSTEYTTAITVSTTTTISAIAIKDGVSSGVTTQTYTIKSASTGTMSLEIFRPSGAAANTTKWNANSTGVYYLAVSPKLSEYSFSVTSSDESVMTAAFRGYYPNNSTPLVYNISTINAGEVVLTFKFDGNSDYKDTTCTQTFYVYDVLELTNTSPVEGDTLDGQTTNNAITLTFEENIALTDSFSATLTNGTTTKTWTVGGDDVTVSRNTLTLSNADANTKGDWTFTLAEGSVCSSSNAYIINESATIKFNINVDEPDIYMSTPLPDDSSVDPSKYVYNNVYPSTNFIFTSDKSLEDGDVTAVIKATDGSEEYTIDGRTDNSPYIKFITTEALEQSKEYTITIAGGQLKTLGGVTISTDRTFKFKTMSYSSEITEKTTVNEFSVGGKTQTDLSKVLTDVSHEGSTVTITLNQSSLIVAGTTLEVRAVNNTNEAAKSQTYYASWGLENLDTSSGLTFNDERTKATFSYSTDELKYDVLYEIRIPAGSLYGATIENNTVTAVGPANSEDITMYFKVESNSSAGNTDVITSNSNAYTWDFSRVGINTETLNNLADAVSNSKTTHWTTKETDSKTYYSVYGTNSVTFPQGCEIQLYGSNAGTLEEYKGLRISLNKDYANDRIRIGQDTTNNALYLVGNTHYLTVPNVPEGTLYVRAKVSGSNASSLFNINSQNAVFEQGGEGQIGDRAGETTVYKINVTEAGDVTFIVADATFYQIAVPMGTKQITSKCLLNGIYYATDCQENAVRYDLTETLTEGSIAGYYIIDNGYTADATSVRTSEITSACAAGAGALVGNETAGIYTYFTTDVNTTPDDASNNLLVGTTADEGMTVTRQTTIDGKTYTQYAFTNVYYQTDKDGNVSEDVTKQTEATPGFYILANQTLTLPKNKCVLRLPNNTASNARKMVLLNFRPSVVSGIDGIDGNKTENAAASDGLYDLRGRKISGTPQSGIYITKGKKVLVP